MALRLGKRLLSAGAVSLLLAGTLSAQRGLGSSPGSLGNSGRGSTGARGNSGDRGPRPSGNIPPGVTPSDRGLGNAPGRVDTPPPQPTRPPNLISPGNPNGSSPGNILSPGTPNRPYRPGNIVTPGTPRPPASGITIAPADRGDDGRGRGREGRRGHSVILYYPLAYGYGSYAYGSDGYMNGSADPNVIPADGNNTSTNPSANYSIDGLDQDHTREPHAKVYEVGPRSAENGVEMRDTEQDAENPVTLVALKGGLVYAVTEHWMLGSTVHFVTTEDEHYVVSLQEVDLDLSARLNRERGMKFVLEVREQTHPSATQR